MRWLRRLWRKAKSSAPAKREVEVEVENNSTVAKKGNVVALVVGHNSYAQGADNYLKESEFTFNSRIARKAKLKLTAKAIPCVILTRGRGSYSSQSREVADACRKHNAKLSVHMHFNSASSAARGVETLILNTSSTLDNAFADVFSTLLNERYAFYKRGDKGSKTISSGHNGYGMMSKVRREGTIPVLIEPCFAHYKNPESELVFEQEDKYVDVLVEAIEKVVNEK